MSFSIRILIPIESMFWKYLMKCSCCRWSFHFFAFPFMICFRVRACVESMKSFVKTLCFFTTENWCAHISKYLQLLFVCNLVGRSLKVCDIWNWMSTTPKLPKTPDDEHYERECDANRLGNIYFLWCGVPLKITVETSLSIELSTSQRNDSTVSFFVTAESLWLESVLLPVNHFIFEQWQCICLGLECRVNLLKK